MDNPFLKHKRPAEEKPEKPEPHPVALAAWEAVKRASDLAGVVRDGPFRPPSWGIPSRENVPSMPTREFFLRLAEHVRLLRLRLASYPTPPAAAVAALRACQEPMQDYARALKKLKAMERLGMRTK